MRLLFFVFVIPNLTPSKPLEDIESNNTFITRHGRSLWSKILIRHKLKDPESSEFYYRGPLRQTFAFQALTSNISHNMVCSPTSALLPLGKLALGAEGPSYHELIDAIGVSDVVELTNSFKTLINNLRQLPGVTLDIASRIYVPINKDINSQFQKSSRDIFESSVERISFNNPYHATEEINSWVSRETKGMIPMVLRPNEISIDASLVIVNAIYFRGKWLKPFNRVVNGEFYSPSGKKKVTMMSRQDFYRYTKNDILKARIVEIPYQGKKTSFIIILPFEKDGLTKLLESVKKSPSLLKAALKDLDEVRVILSIPKFKIQSTLDLTELYHRIGVRQIFLEKDTGLNGIIKNQEVAVSNAVQKAIIDVNEKGTDAASATVIEVVPVALYLNQVVFQANHPFMFMVLAENEQLFAGIFKEPN